MIGKFRTTTALILIAVALGAAWLLWEKGDSHPDGEDQRLAPPAAFAARGNARQGEEGEATGARPIATDPFDPASEAPPDIGAELCSVLVVDRERRPVAGAEVFFQVHRWAGLTMSMPLSLPPPEPPLRIARTGRDGLAHLPPLSKRGVLIHARTPSASGWTEWLRHPDERHHLGLPLGADAVVVLEPIRFLEIQVLDDLGAPAPHVHLDVFPPYPPDWGLTEVLLLVARRGMCALRTPEPDALLRIPIRSDHPYTPSPASLIADFHQAETAVIMVPLPGRDRLTRRIQLEPEGTTSVTLSLPPTVVVHLEIRESGSPERISFPVHVTWADVGKSENGGPRYRYGNLYLLPVDRALSGTLAVENGRCSFGGFPPGFELGLVVRAKGRVPTTREVVLPARGNQTEIILEVGAPHAHLEVRILEPDGRPVGHAHWRTKVQPGDAERTSLQEDIEDRDRRAAVESDAEGTIRIAVPPDQAGTIELRDPLMESRESLIATLPLPELQPGELHRAGDLKLEGRARLVSGVVVAGREPQSGVTVEVERLRVSGSDRTGRRRFSKSFSTQTDAQGRFGLHCSDKIAGEVEILARSNDSVSERIWVPVGTDDVRLALVQLGSINGSVRFVDPSIPVSVSLSLRPHDGSWDRAYAFIPSGRITPDAPAAGVFRIERLMPGIYDLQVTIAGVEAARFEGLEVNPGEHSAPPALQNLMLDPHVARVEVQDPEDNPLPGISVHYRWTLGRERTQSARTTDARGVAEIVIPRGTQVTVEIGRTPTPQTGQPSISIPNARFPLVITLEKPPK